MSESDDIISELRARLEEQTARAENNEQMWLSHKETVEIQACEITALTDKLDAQSVTYQDNLTEIQFLKAEIADLTAKLAVVEQERNEHKEMAEWFLALVPRANIGTKKTPSLRAYIEQLEQQLTEAQATIARLEQHVMACDVILHTHGEQAAAAVKEYAKERDQLQATLASYQVREELHAGLSERVRLQERIDELERAPLAIVEGFRVGWKAEKDQLQATVTAQAEEMGQLREALESIAGYAGDNGCCPYGCDIPEIAKQALAPPEAGGKKEEEK